MTGKLKKTLLANLPYLLFAWLFDKLCQTVRLSPGADASEKLLRIAQGFTEAFASLWLSLHPLDLLLGVAGAALVRLAVHLKAKNAKKYRRGVEYGSARWGRPEDIAPYIDPVPDWNIPLTRTESLTMTSRPKDPKTARNKNILVIGGSGSGKTRFFVKPSLLQMHSSYVVTDPKGQLLRETGKLLAHGGPKRDENGKPVRDKHGKVVYEPYRIKVLNTINFSKSMKYNPLAYVQTPADIAEQARAAQGEPVGSFSIYQLKGGNETLDYRFEPLDSIHRNGLSVKPENYELVYEAPLTAKDNLESIYTRFNVDRPADFTGHSLSVSDIVVLHQDGKDTAHYCDRAGFSEVPEFLQPAQKSREITERIQTPRGSFYLCGMTREQMEADGYGFHHASEDGKYLIMANGTQAYAVRADAPEKDNPLRTAEMTLEDDYGMIDGVINNGRRGEELEKAKEHAERTQPEKKPSIRERLAAAKQECARQQPRPAPEKKPPELGER